MYILFLNGGNSMEFFDKLGKKTVETYKVTTEKTGKIAKEAKLRILMNEDKSKISDIYEEIGKKVYEKHIREEDYDIKEPIEELCISIDQLSQEIEDSRMEILKLKDKKQCKNCFSEIENEFHYCPNCGVKQEKQEETIETDPEEEYNNPENGEPSESTVNNQYTAPAEEIAVEADLAEDDDLNDE